MTALPSQNQGHPTKEASAAGLPVQVMSAATAPARTAAHPRWTDETLWRRWALRMLGVWVLLSLLLVGLRVATAAIRPELRDAQTAQQELVKQRDMLSLEVQSLSSASRITAWAEEAGMLRFADSLKRSAKLTSVGAPQEPAPPPPLKLNWQWGSGNASKQQQDAAEKAGTP